MAELIIVLTNVLCLAVRIIEEHFSGLNHEREIIVVIERLQGHKVQLSVSHRRRKGLPENNEFSKMKNLFLLLQSIPVFKHCFHSIRLGLMGQGLWLWHQMHPCLLLSMSFYLSLYCTQLFYEVER
jgi:hypothetical protein